MPEDNQDLPQPTAIDVVFGDVSGQVAIGDNNLQVTKNNWICTLPNGTIVGGKTWRYTQGIRPMVDQNRIFGRQQELEKIDHLLENSSCLAITGFRGTGKSTVASMYLDRIEKTGKYAGIFWRRIDETTDISDIVGSFFTVIGKPIKKLNSYKIEDQLALLFQELETVPYFLVLDNFEVLINPQTHEPMKHEFSELVEKANQLSSKSRVLFTCWECPVSQRGIIPERLQISGLDPQASLKLLRMMCLTDAESDLTCLIKRSSGHPLALILLAQLVKGGEESVSQALADESLWKGEVSERILDKVYCERLCDNEREVLQFVSLFRESVSINTLIAVAKDKSWTESFIKKVALGLNRKSLLNKTGENYWEESLIQSYAYNKMKDRVCRHKLACDYYLSLPIPKKPTKKEDVRTLIEAHHHACMAKEYDKAAKILFGKNLDQDLFIWGNCRTLTELYLMLLPRDNPLEGNSLLSEMCDQAYVLGNLGNVYDIIGDFGKAIDYSGKALKIVRQIGDKRGEGTWLGNLGISYDSLGDYAKAIKHYSQALDIAKQIGDKQNESTWLGNLGNTNESLGDYAKAIENYTQALDIARQIGDKQGEGIWVGNLGNTNESLGDYAKAIENYTQALDIARQIGDKQGEGTWLGNLGNAFNSLGDNQKAIENCVKALDIARQIGDKRGEGVRLGNIGKAYNSLGDNEKAIENYVKALDIARQIGDKQFEGTWLNAIGSFFCLFENKNSESLACYLLAKRIREELGNSKETEETQFNLKNLEKKLGEKEFTKLRSQVGPKAEEIMRKIMKSKVVK
jgi:tetratricopeptide (TPR) repeat protein